jgi:hypothetical protein
MASKWMQASFRSFIKNGDAYLDGTIGILIIILIVFLAKKVLF